MIKKILKITGIVALVLVFLLTLAIVLGAVLRNERLLSPWGTAFFIIASGSMEPSIPTGSIVLVTSVAPDEIKVRDVITFFASGKNAVVTHRVEGISADGGDYLYVTRGDANDTNDRPFGYDMVIGRVAYTIPGSSFLISLLGSVKYVGIVIIGLGLVLCFASVLKGAKKKKEFGEGSSEGHESDENGLISDEALEAASEEAGYDRYDVDFDCVLDEVLKEDDSNEEISFDENDD